MPPMLPVSDKSQDDFSQGKSGQWDKRSWNDLEKIANRTPATGSEKRKIEVDLIPDVWARLILFSNALYDEKHLLHKDVVAAFRGALALLALRKRKNIVIKEDELHLERVGNWPFAAAARNSEDGGKHRIHQLYSDTSWNEIYLLRGDGGSLLAITSPLTLICPAHGPSTMGLKQLPSSWFDGAQFRDPSVPGVLNDEDRELLAAWLRQLRTNLAHHGMEAAGSIAWPEGQNLLLRTIGKFEEALGGNVRAAAPIAEGVLRLGNSAYRYLGSAIRAEEIRLEHSDIVLDSTLSVNAILLPIRVSEKDVSIEPQTDPSKVTVVSGTSLLDINTVVWGDKKRILAGRALPAEAEWLDPKSLFLDRLYLLKGTQARSGMNHARGQRDVADHFSEYPVMPFSHRLTELLPAEQIVQNTRFAVENHGGGDVVVVKLRLPLKGGKSLEVSRTYSSEQQSSMAQIPVLEVWPPFRKKGWKFYNTFWWTNSELAFTAEPFPLPAQGRIEEQTESLPLGQKIRVVRLDSAPDGFALQVPHAQRGASAMQPAGLIFTKLNEIVTPPKGTWSAGVDFGTSSTNVVLSASDDRERPLTLRQSGPLRVVVGRDADRPEALYKYFLPFTPELEKDAEQAPFLSFLRMRHPDQTSFEAIVDAHVLFYNPSHNIHELSAGRLATNLKWDGEAKGRSRPYLQQVCLQTAAEAAMGGAERIDWFYSLPAAFTPRKVDDYKREWNQIARFLAEETGIGSTQKSLEPMTESLATARYFKEREEAPPEVGAIFLDIGGGTTDISIWQESTGRCDLSIRFAGRDMFLAPLFQLRSRLLPEFASIAPELVSQETVSRLIADQLETEFFAHAEAMLRDAGVVLAQKLHLKDRLEMPALPLRFGVAGLFYYVGILLRNLEQANLYRRDLGGVFLGGNGSQLLHWADGGEYDPTGSFARLLKESLFAGAGWTEKTPQNIQIKISAKPKQEAATGLVVKSTLQSAVHWDDVIAGEPFTLAGVQKSETDLVTRTEIPFAEITRLPQLELFYDNYLRISEKIGYPRVGFSKETLFARVVERVREFIADQKGKYTEDVDLTPLFIKGLQTLVIGVARESDRSRGATSGR